MINYTLKCDQNHTFDSWFKSAEAFEMLVKKSMVVCSECGSTKITKAIMAPSVSTSRKKDNKPSELEKKSKLKNDILELKKKIEANSEYVGNNFANEARSMYLGETPERSIYGEAKADDAKKLIDDGIPVMPLPFLPAKKAN
ncbi:MAG: hypothetical protein CML54_01600 [Rhodobacteraceae bacterium]|jgi:hypothetical protein|nr:hypothetical protein [Paracoccaceae bacterium]|tara:strand:- start:120 stop:545 length:426 start_codon:yes stop_codon:yes gene_type:complete